MPPLLRYEDYKIAWIAILPVEVDAAVTVLDKIHDGHFDSMLNDKYTYIAGEINGHNVVIVKPPASENYGTGTAAALASHVDTRFPVWFALLVGVAAGLPNLSTKDPNRRRDIRLGDVLVCMPDKSSTGLVHYDLGTNTDSGFTLTGRQAETPPLIRSVIGSIQVLRKRPFRTGNRMAMLLDKFHAASSNAKFHHPGQDQDELFQYATHSDASKATGHYIARQPRDESERSLVWYGRIGSGNTLMRNARKRDELRDKFDLIGLEMEAAGVMNVLPTGVIRGVCDYGDAHKTDQWQPYAAAVAAVYAKAILLELPPQKVSISLRAPAVELPGQPNPTAYRYPLPRDRKSYFGQQLKEQSGRFCGRENVLELLNAMTEADRLSENKKVIALSGLGGIGKTEILLEYGLMARRSNHVFYCQANHGQSFESCIANLANAVGSEVLDSSVELDIREKRWNSYRRDQRVHAFINWLRSGPEGSSLILFDDIDAIQEENDRQALSTAIRSWPHTVLITTRDPDLGDSLAAESSKHSESHCIEALSEEELIPIMRRFINERTCITTEDLATIASLMDGHAMAACRAVQFISQVLSLSTEDPVGHFIAGFENGGDNFAMREEFIRFQPRLGRSLAMCFETSIHRLGELEGIATRVLSFAAYLSSPRIDFRLILQHRRPWLPIILQRQHFISREIFELSSVEFRKVLKHLVATSALIWIGQRLTVHSLMQEYLFHRHGVGGRTNILRQIMLLASASTCLEEKIPVFEAVIRRCKEIATKFSIDLNIISPSQETLDAIKVHALAGDVGSRIRNLLHRKRTRPELFLNDETKQQFLLETRNVIIKFKQILPTAGLLQDDSLRQNLCKNLIELVSGMSPVFHRNLLTEMWKLGEQAGN